MLVGPQGSGKTHIGQAWRAETGGMFIDNASGVKETKLFTIMNQALNGEIVGLLLADTLAPAHWAIQLPDLHSRLTNTPLAILEEHDDEILEPIVRRLYEDKGRVISQSLIEYLLKYKERSVAAQRVIAAELEVAAQQQKADLTKAFAAKYLKSKSERDGYSIPSKE